MIEPETITRKQAKKLVRLLEQETRCEIMARFGRFDNLGYADYAVKQIELKDRIRRMLFDTDSIVELGFRWGLVNQHSRKKRKKKSKKKKWKPIE
jgi:hypothetical protein